MPNENADLIRRAYEAYANGDLAAMLEFIDPTWNGPTWIPPWSTPSRRSATAATSWRACCGTGPSMVCGPSRSRSPDAATW
jgi:ketosteroid isomerase-like protein